MKFLSMILALAALLATLACPVWATTPENTSVRDTYKDAALAAVYEGDISSMRRALDLGLLTCEDLTRFYLDRIDAYNDTYNCFITICDDAMDIAREKDAQIAAGTAAGSLFGIPVVVKDNMDYKGWHTTSGHKKTDSQIADSNADVVQYLLDEGAIIIGKTNMSTDAQDARASISSAVGQTKNAYSTNITSGGSSGGSASAVSLNFAAAALGTDTNSSLRYPAALNGCVSLRPTWDILSTKGIDTLNKTRDVPGVLTRTVYDQALVLDVMSGGATNYTENLNADSLQGMRIGVLKQLYQPSASRPEEQIDGEIVAAFENALKELEACGAELVYMRIDGLISKSNATLNTNDSSPKKKLHNAFLAGLEEYHVSAVVFPTYITAPLKTGTDESGVSWDIYSQDYITNCKILGPSCGVPEISVPIGTHSTGAGIGMEICAPKNEEQQLLNMAYSYTLRYDHREIPAGTPNLLAEDAAGSLDEVINRYKYDLANPTEPPTEEPTEKKEKPTKAPKPTDPTEQAENPSETPQEKTPFDRRWLLVIPAALLVLVILDRIHQAIQRKKRRKKRRKPRMARIK